MRKILMAGLAAALVCTTTVAAAPAAPADLPGARLLAYDAKAPLDVQYVGRSTVEGVTVEEISYASPRGGRVPALVYLPLAAGKRPAVLVMHGAPGSKEGKQFEAVALAKRGAVVLAIDAPFARGDRRGKIEETLHFDERDAADIVQLIVDLRRGVDYLLTRQDVDGARIGFVGISYGAANGGILAGVEKRIKAYALMVADGGLLMHFSAAPAEGSPFKTPEQRARWEAAVKPLQSIDFIRHAAPSALLLQSGRQDKLVSVANAEAFQAVAPEPKTIIWYDAGHGLTPAAHQDRYTWLAGQIGISADPLP